MSDTFTVGASIAGVPSLDLLRQPAFWQKLNPQLKVCDPASFNGVGTIDVSNETAGALEQALVREGYFALPPQSWGLPIDALATGVRNLVANEFVPPFAFVYDEFWLLWIKLSPILGKLLGPGYRMLPDFWAWHVDPKRGEAGWTPHRDKGHVALFPDGRPKSLTVWLPLTDATTLNGCMYLVPADRDPVYGTPEENNWAQAVKFAAIRALPAAAGSFLCWNQAVLHWGAQTSPRGTDARISCAFEFQRGDVEPMNPPLIDPFAIPDLPTRLRLIGKQVLQYQHMYPLSPTLRAVAEAALRIGS